MLLSTKTTLEYKNYIITTNLSLQRQIYISISSPGFFAVVYQYGCVFSCVYAHPKAINNYSAVFGNFNKCYNFLVSSMAFTINICSVAPIIGSVIRNTIWRQMMKAFTCRIHLSEFCDTIRCSSDLRRFVDHIR